MAIGGQRALRPGRWCAAGRGLASGWARSPWAATRSSRIWRAGGSSTWPHPGGSRHQESAVVLVHSELRPRLFLRLEVPADAERAIGIDAPGELDPELVLLPDLPRIDQARVRDRLAEALAGGAQHRLPEAQPLGVVRLVRVQVVTLRADAHRQHVVSEEGCLAPGGREGNMEADPGLVREHFDPPEAVGVRPHRVVDAREVDLEAAAALREEVRQQERELV